MDVSVALRSVENLTRDTFQHVLSQVHGSDWTEKCGVSPQRIAIWKSRKEEDEKRNGRGDPRLIYYSDFYDLAVVLRKNWDSGLSEIFNNLKETEVFLGVLEDLRNPEAHRREFLPFETQLASGIAGRMRAQVTKYFSQRETSESYYPRIELVQDSLGNSFKIGQSKVVTMNSPIRPGAQLQFKIVASDPLGGEIEYCVYPNAPPFSPEWNSSGEFSFDILDSFVGDVFIFVASIRSTRQHHSTREPMLGSVDDIVRFTYMVLPPKIG